MNQEIELNIPQKVTIVDSIVEQIVAKIRTGSLKPGDRLPSTRQLIEILGVSRSSVREALQILAAMGLVDTKHGKGTYVKEPIAIFNPKENIELHPRILQKQMRYQINQARLILEQGIVSLASEMISKSDGEIILQALNDYFSSQSKNITHIEWQAHDRMHLAIAKTTGNNYLVQILQSLLVIVPESLRERGVLFGSREESMKRRLLENDIHKNLCEAIIRGDGKAALEWMNKHAQAEEDIIARYYEDIT